MVGGGGDFQLEVGGEGKTSSRKWGGDFRLLSRKWAGRGRLYLRGRGFFTWAGETWVGRRGEAKG